MNQTLIIKLKKIDGIDYAAGTLQESPPMLYTSIFTLFPNIQFNNVADANILKDIGYGLFEWDWSPTVEYNKTADPIGVTLHKDNIWRPSFVIRDATKLEIQQRTQEKVIELNEFITYELQKSYYLQYEDNNNLVTNEQWDLYRQQLKDIVNQKNYPWNVIIPKKLR